MVETLHATCKMSSLLEICFSAWQLRFTSKYRELCVATGSCLMEKIMDLMIYILSSVISSEGLDLLFGLCLKQGFEFFEVLKDLIFLPEKVDPCKT
jgi:hypothetical protein